MPELHPQFEAVLYSSGSIVTIRFRDILYRQIYEKGLAANIQKKTGWSSSQFRSVSWEAYERAFRGQTTFKQIAVMKLSHDLWNTGAQKKLFGQDTDGICPVCSAALETMDHIFQCDAPQVMALKHQLLEELREELAILGTPGMLIRSLSAGLEWWLINSTNSDCPRAPGFGKIYAADVWSTTAYAEQTGLGWGQLLRGHMSMKWGEAYVKEMRSTKPKESHAEWTKRVIKLLWNLAFQIWANRNGILHGRTVEEQWKNSRISARL
jgi:hypothetical protein